MSTIYKNIFFSETTGGKETKLGQDVPKEVPYQNCSNGPFPCGTLVAMATERKIFENLLLQNQWPDLNEI
jgi:hypothetical protein